MLNQPFFIPTAIMLVLALLLISGLLPRQGLIGIRTPKTLSDDAIWVRANRFAGWVLLASSLIYLLTAWSLPCSAPCGIDFAQWLLHLGAFVLPLAISLVLTGFYVRSL
jgi:SdpI/YfhL protein family